MLRNTAAACIAALLIAVPQAQAQDQEQSQKSGEDIEFVRAIGSGEWLSSDLIGQSVNNSEGETIGDVNGLIIGDDNEVTAAVIGVGGFLGIGEKSVAVNYDAVERKKNEDGEVVLSANLTKEQLESAPEFEGSRSSDTMEQTGDAASEDPMEAAEQAAEEAQEMAGEAAEKVKQAGESARQKASEMTDGESTTQN